MPRKLADTDASCDLMNLTDEAQMMKSYGEAYETVQLLNAMLIQWK